MSKHITSTYTITSNLICIRKNIHRNGICQIFYQNLIDCHEKQESRKHGSKSSNKTITMCTIYMNIICTGEPGTLNYQTFLPYSESYKLLFNTRSTSQKTPAVTPPIVAVFVVHLIINAVFSFIR